jgi:hypothetical protein
MEYSSEEEYDEEAAAQAAKNAETPGFWSGYTPKQRKELGVVDHSTIDYEGFG